MSIDCCTRIRCDHCKTKALIRPSREAAIAEALRLGWQFATFTGAAVCPGCAKPAEPAGCKCGHPERYHTKSGCLYRDCNCIRSTLRLVSEDR